MMFLTKEEFYQRHAEELDRLQRGEVKSVGYTAGKMGVVCYVDTVTVDGVVVAQTLVPSQADTI